jgi:hypothetical protein
MAFWLPLLSGLGSLFGGMASGKADAKQQQANTAQQQNSGELAAYTAAQAGAARRAEDVATRPGQRLAQGLQGNVVTGFQSPTVDWGGAGTIPKVSGGWQDLPFNDMSKMNATMMQRDALLRQMQGQGAADITPVAAPPDMSKNYPDSKGSWLDTLLGLGGMAGGVADIYGQYKNTATPEDPWKQTGIPRR